MKTPSQIIRDEINKAEASPLDVRTEWEWDIADYLANELLPLIEEYEANSVERLLAEMPARVNGNYLVLKKYIAGFRAYYPDFQNKCTVEGNGPTPQEALQKLKEALNNQE